MTVTNLLLISLTFFIFKINAIKAKTIAIIPKIKIIKNIFKFLHFH